jgi:hypothetical protein
VVKIDKLNAKRLPDKLTFSVTVEVPLPPAINGVVPKTTHTKKYILDTSAIRAEAKENGFNFRESKALAV